MFSNHDIKMIQEHKGVFEGAESVELIGIVSCGGCPGKNAILRAKEMVKRGADTIAFVLHFQRQSAEFSLSQF